MSLLLLVLGCKPVLPPELENPYSNPHPECGHSTHYFAQGIGTTPQDAIERSKKEISSQISSDIQSVFQKVSTTMLSYSEDGNQKQREVQANKVLMEQLKTSTSFGHAELMKTIIPPQEYNGQFYTLTCLNKQETVDVLLDEQSPKVNHWLKTVQKTLDGYKENPLDTSGFSTHYHKLVQDRPSILKELYQVRSILGKKSQYDLDMESAWLEVIDVAEEMMSKISIGLSAGSIDIEANERRLVQESIRKGFTENGLKVIDAVTCNNKTSHLAVVDIKANCKPPGTVGILCQPILNIELVSCEQEEAVTFNLSDKDISGQDFYSEDKAVHNALKKLDSHSFTEHFYGELQSVFPVYSTK